MAEPDNEERANDGEEAIKYFAKRVHQEDEDLKTNMTDLLADLMHLADFEDINFEEIFHTAKDHFDTEKAEEGEEENEEEEVEENEEEETSDQS